MISFDIFGMDCSIPFCMALYQLSRVVSISSVVIVSGITMLFMLFPTTLVNISQFALFVLGLGSMGLVIALEVRVIIMGRWSDSVIGPASIVMLCIVLLFPMTISGDVLAPLS